MIPIFTKEFLEQQLNIYKEVLSPFCDNPRQRDVHNIIRWYLLNKLKELDENEGET